MIDIRSAQNPKIKLVRSLQQRKFRRKTGLFLVSGLRHLGELADSDFEIEFVCCAPELVASDFGQALLQRFETSGVPTYSTYPDLHQTLTDRDNASGILAVARQKWTVIADAPPTARPRSVAIVAPQDPGNVGTILRTMDAAETGALFLLDGGADPWHPSAVRAAMGALFWRPIYYGSFADFAAWCVAAGINVYGSSARGEVDYREAEFVAPAALLLGSERTGLTDEQAGLCRQILSIPMGGRGSSLNLAVAAGLLIYQMRNAQIPE